LILFLAVNLGPVALGTAPISIGQALLFGSLQGSLLN
jgi:hypothetical protein